MRFSVRKMSWLHLASRILLAVASIAVVYILLCGVSIQLHQRRAFGEWGEELMVEFVGPGESLAMNGPVWLAYPIRWYFSWCSTAAGGPVLVY